MKSVQLNDRKLWIDGTSSFNPRFFKTQVQLHDIKYVDFMTDEIKNVNKLLLPKDRIKEKSDCELPVPKWNIPDYYSNLDIISYIKAQHESLYANDPNFDQRLIRLGQELSLFYKLGMVDILRTIIYIINTFLEKDIVWGFGRGSSVASYVLHVIGLHDIDSFQYELDSNEFFQQG